MHLNASTSMSEWKSTKNIGRKENEAENITSMHASIKSSKV